MSHFGSRFAFLYIDSNASSGSGAMSYRRFTDADGRTWEVWEVHPSVIERRVNADRRGLRRAAVDRRRAREFRLAIPLELSQGWLAIQAQTEKLRLAPIPLGWTHLTDEELSALIDRAQGQMGLEA